MSGPYYFRDGRQYEGHQVCNFSVEKGEGIVRVLKQSTNRRRHYAWVHVYTKARLAELDDNRRKHRKSLSALALIGVKRDFARFARERDRLLTDMQTFAPMSAPLQILLDKVHLGQILTLAEVRTALQLVITVRSKFNVTAS